MIIAITLLIAAMGVIFIVVLPVQRYQERTAAANAQEAIASSYSLLLNTVFQDLIQTHQLPESHRIYGDQWPKTLGSDIAVPELIEGTYQVTFTRDAGSRLAGETIGISFHGDSRSYDMQCGTATIEGNRLSALDSAELTSLGRRYLPGGCR